MEFKADLSPGHYVASFCLRTNDEANAVVGPKVTCDVQVTDQNDVSVLFNDLMDINKKESKEEIDARFSALGFEREGRAPRESMAPGA